MILPCKDILCEHCFLDLQEQAKLACPKCGKGIPKEFDVRMTKGKMRYCIPLLSTLFRAMEFSIKLYKIKVGWSIVCIEGLQVITFFKKSISFSVDGFYLDSKQCRP